MVFAPSRRWWFISAVAAIHPRFGTPARAIALQALLASLLVGLGSFNQIVSYFVFVVVIFIALTVAALFLLRRKSAHTPQYLTPGYPVAPVIFLLLVAMLLILLASDNPKQAFVGAGVVALGIPVYYLLFRREQSSQTDRGNTYL